MTLDPDVADAIDQIRRRDGRRFKVVLNEVLRRGLDTSPRRTEAGQATVPRDLGVAHRDIVSISGLLDELDTRT